MLITRVTARAFGPLVDQTLELGEGLTVVFGPNESAKSSWHAAVYAALCGRRRKGGSTKDDREFLARHRPWDGDGWEVSARLRLADGRRVELHQDLDAKVDCQAVDLDLGTDLTAEIIEEGAPDAARWLGLDRRSFRATACVGQAQLGAVKGADLQEHLQRATSTAGDATAAEALRRIGEFQREQVGADRANSGRPLPRARAAAEAATTALGAAQVAHADHVERATRLDQLRAAEAAARARLAEAEAVARTQAQAQAQARAHAEAEARAQAEERAVERARAQARALAEKEAALAAELRRRAQVQEQETAALKARLAALEAAPIPTRPLPPGVPAPSPVAPARARLAAGVGAALIVVGLILIAVLPLAAGIAVTLLGAALLAVAVTLALRPPPTPPPPPSPSPPPSRPVSVDHGAATVPAPRSAPLPSSVEPADDPVTKTSSPPPFGYRITPREEGLREEGLREEGLREEGTAAARAAVEEAAAARHAAEGALAAIAATLPSVAEAEERLAAAQAELARVEALDATLTTTTRFLAQAQQRVQRDLAPILADAVRSHLPTVTGGRYTDVIVDPAQLEVKVSQGGRWREATLLSHGTTEQIYLLLRIALAEQLTRPGESCPLLLDDVTVHADPARTQRLLELLLDAAARHQVVLFTQEAQVRDWARAQAGVTLRELPALVTV